MDIRDILLSLEALVVLAIFPMALYLLLSHFGQRKRARLSKWQRIGLTPQTNTWRGLWSWDVLAGQHRGRSVTMSWRSDTNTVQIRIAVSPRSGQRLSILPNVSFLRKKDSRQHPPIRQRNIPNQVSIQSEPHDLAAQVLAIPGFSAMALSHPQPEVRLKTHELQLDRIGYFPEPRAATALLDVLCATAELIERRPDPTGSKDPVEESGDG